jgi:RsmE family RNA methyltransferase
MNLILLLPDDFRAPDRVRLGGRRAEHIRRVQRAALGDALRVGRLDGEIGAGIVTAICDDAVELGVTLDRPPPPPAPVRLVLALPRPKALRRILQGVAAMGVKDIVVCQSWRVEKSYWTSPALADDALRHELLLGLEQGGEDRLAELARGSRRLLAHPAAARACPRGLAEPATLVVGPEGGFIEYELDALAAQGFEAVTLGPRPLRVEQAVAALLGRLL